MGVEVAEAPPVVRAGGLLVVAQGLAVLTAGALFVGDAGFGVWGFLWLLGGGAAALGVALVLGRRGARPPATVLQMLTLGVSFYAAVPSGRPEWGVPAALLAAAVLATLFCARARAWAAA